MKMRLDFSKNAYVFIPVVGDSSEIFNKNFFTVSKTGDKIIINAVKPIFLRLPESCGASVILLHKGFLKFRILLAKLWGVLRGVTAGRIKIMREILAIEFRHNSCNEKYSDYGKEELRLDTSQAGI
jgi:hypothetical protein